MVVTSFPAPSRVMLLYNVEIAEVTTQTPGGRITRPPPEIPAARNAVFIAAESSVDPSHFAPYPRA